MIATATTREARRASSSTFAKTADKRIAVPVELTLKQLEIVEAAAKTLRLPVAQAIALLALDHLNADFDGKGEFIAQHFETLELMEQDRLCLDQNGDNWRYAVEEGAGKPANESLAQGAA